MAISLEEHVARLEKALKDAAIVARTTPLQTDPIGWYSDGFKDARSYIADRLDDIIRSAFSDLPAPDPAEEMREELKGSQEMLAKVIDEAISSAEAMRTKCEEAAQSLAAMVVEYVDEGVKMKLDWRPSLSRVIALRLTRCFPACAALKGNGEGPWLDFGPNAGGGG